MKATDIIYKAKRTDNGQWVQGSFCNHSGRYEILVKHSDNILDYDLHVIKLATLCIGFKDESGMCWFAGDRVTISGANQSGVIEFYINDGFSIKLDSGKTISISHVFEVTGNIHD